WQIVQALNANPDLTGEIKTIPAEGSLLPETYLYEKGASREKIIADMKTAMGQTIQSLWPTRSSNLPFDTIEQAITLASIVEKETGIPSERATIAGVFINRLNRGMKLQTDPTIIYAITK